MIEFLDFYPTIASYCGLEGIPEYLEGMDFGMILEDPGKSYRHHVNTIIRIEYNNLSGEEKYDSLKTVLRDLIDRTAI